MNHALLGCSGHLTLRDPRNPMVKETLLSGAFCLAAFTLMTAVLSSTSPLTAQNPGDAYTSSGCGQFSGPLCKTVKVESCTGSSCTTETSYYYYSPVVE